MNAERLRHLLTYSEETGEFVNRVSRPRVAAGAKAGSVCKNGYLYIGLDRKKYLAHRLAWLYVHGEWPAEYLDHKDANPLNNRIGNLRQATNAQNGQNQTRPKAGNKQNVLGITAHGSGFKARIVVDGKQRHLGTFRTPQAAGEAYVQAKRSLHEFCTI